MLRVVISELKYSLESRKQVRCPSCDKLLWNLNIGECWGCDFKLPDDIPGLVRSKTSRLEYHRGDDA